MDGQEESILGLYLKSLHNLKSMVLLHEVMILACSLERDLGKISHLSRHRAIGLLVEKTDMPFACPRGCLNPEGGSCFPPGSCVDQSHPSLWTASSTSESFAGSCPGLHH